MKLHKLVAPMMILLFAFGLVSLSTDISGTEVIEVTLNESEIEFDVLPEIKNNRTMVPLRATFEAFDMEVNWNSLLGKVTATRDDLTIVLYIGMTIAYVNGEEMVIDSTPYITNGRTMVPIRFIAESTGAVVQWDAINRQVAISSEDSTITANNEMTLSYPIVDTGITSLFSNRATVNIIDSGDDFYGQDGHYTMNAPSYADLGDGTVLDNVTGLIWQQTMDEKMRYDEAVTYANDARLGGYTDWRLPSIKELFSLIQYTGQSGGETASVLYIDTDYFDQPIGDTSIGEREIDAQVWSSTKYVGLTMRADETCFGVNFIDGRIKGYGLSDPRTREDKEMYFRLVRGNEAYGVNNFIDNGDGTITDLATGLMWQMSDDGQVRDWEEALAYSEDLTLGEHSDWRLPNAKELQSIVDYTKSIQTTGTAAIDELFDLTEIIDPNGTLNYGYYWTSTTHQDGRNISDGAVYVAFGEALGQMFGEVLDVHGAGAVRSDPKSGIIEDYPVYFGPQGDLRAVYNYVLAVRTTNP